jgi:hypothetical protein
MSKPQPTYRRILTSFWTDPEVRSRRLSTDQRILLLYLFTSPHSNLAGLYWLPLAYAAAETGLAVPDVEEWIQGPLSAYVTYDHETEEVFVHRLARHNIGEDLKATDNRAKALERALLDIHSKPLLRLFFHNYPDWPIDLGENMPDDEPEPPNTPTPPTDSKGITKGLPQGAYQGAGGSHSSIMPHADTEQLHTHASDTKGLRRGFRPPPGQEREGELSWDEQVELRGQDRETILRDLHLGEDVVEVNGKPVSMKLEMHIRDQLAAAVGPRRLNAALRTVRRVEEIPHDAPITLRLLEQRPEVLHRALAAVDQDAARAGPDPTAGMVSIKRIPNGARTVF